MLCAYSIAGFSQEKAKEEAKNEIRLNLLSSICSFPEISYERTWGNSFGAGLSAGFSLTDDDIWGMKYEILPYGRFYFGRNPSKLFFIEGHFAIVGQESYDYYDYQYSNGVYISSSPKTTPFFGLGVAIGYKFMNKYGFTGELLLGIGRTFANDNSYPRVGISIGKSF